MCFAILVFAAAAFQAQVPVPVTGHIVPLRLPSIIPAGSHVCTSQVIDKRGQLTRIFRYSYKASLSGEIASLEAALKKSGWRLEKGKNPYALDKTEKGDIVQQAMLVYSAHLVFDKREKQWCHPYFKSGWVWVSYNELYST